MKLSIVIPVHNGSAYIVRCLSSIAKQKIEDSQYEIVVVEDCSTDNSYFIAERFGEDFANFKLVKTKKQSGPGGARNLGVNNATGDYIFFVDVDDYLPDDSLTQIFKAIGEDQNKYVDVIQYPYSIIRKNSKTDIIIPQTKSVEDCAMSAVGPWTAVFRRSKYVPMPENTLSEDTAWHYWLYDQFDSWKKIEGKTPCYVYDRSNATAITDTVEWCGSKQHTMEQLVIENLAIKEGKNDKWISDVIRNFANMYDVRHKLTKPGVRAAWLNRFMSEYSNLMIGKFVH